MLSAASPSQASGLKGCNNPAKGIAMGRRRHPQGVALMGRNWGFVDAPPSHCAPTGLNGLVWSVSQGDALGCNISALQAVPIQANDN